MSEEGKSKELSKQIEEVIGVGFVSIREISKGIYEVTLIGEIYVRKLIEFVTICQIGVDGNGSEIEGNDCGILSEVKRVYIREEESEESKKKISILVMKLIGIIYISTI